MDISVIPCMEIFAEDLYIFLTVWYNRQRVMLYLIKTTGKGKGS